VDTTWAKHQLTHFLQLTELRRPPPTPGIVDMTGRMVTAARNDEIIPAAQVVEQILDRVLGDWRSAQPERMSNRWVHHREAAQRALAQLERDDEIRERLGRSYVAWTCLIPLVTRGISVFWGVAFWLCEGEWDHRLDELEGLALGRRWGGELLDGCPGRAGEDDVVAGEGGQVVQQGVEAMGWGAVGQLVL
jgi:hypothetical protein